MACRTLNKRPLGWLLLSCVAGFTHACIGEPPDEMGGDGGAGEGGADAGSGGRLGGGTGGHLQTGGAGGASGGESSGGFGGTLDGGAGGFGGAPSCAPGTYVVTDEPLACVACPYGTFSSEKNAEACTPWAEQECPWDYASVGTATKDAACRWRQFSIEVMGQHEPTGVVVDSEDNVIVVGQMSWNDPAGFLTKIDAAGGVVWTHEFDDSLVAIAVDGEASLYSISNRDSGGTNGEKGILTKYDTFGEPSHRVEIDSSGSDQALALAAGPDGAIYVGGATDGDLFAENQSGADGFLIKYDQAGGLVWGLQFGTAGGVRNVAVGTDGGLVLLRGNTVQKLSTTDGGEIWTTVEVLKNLALDGNSDIYTSDVSSLSKFAGDDHSLDWEWAPYCDECGTYFDEQGDVAAGPGGVVAVTFLDTYDYRAYDGYLLTSEGDPFDQWLLMELVAFGSQQHLALSVDAVVVAGQAWVEDGDPRYYVKKALFLSP